MKNLSFDDFVEIKRISDVALSPDGTKAAVTVISGSVEKDRYLSDIWLWADGNFRQLTDLGIAASPLWEDNGHILFPADLAGEKKAGEKLTVYNRISVESGEISRAFSLPLLASWPKYTADGKLIVFGYFDNDEDGRKSREGRYEVFDEMPFRADGVGITNKKRNRIYLTDPKNGECEALTPPLFAAAGYCYDLESELLVYWGSEFETFDTQKDELYILNLASRDLVKVPLGNDYAVHGCNFVNGYVSVRASRGELMGAAESSTVYKLDPESGEFSLMFDPDIDFSHMLICDSCAVGASSYGRPDAVYVIATKGYEAHLFRMTEDGLTDLTPGFASVTGFDERGGVIAFSGMEKNGLQELYILKDGKVTQVSSLNDEYLSSHRFSEPVHLAFTDPDGFDIDGWVIKPHDYTGGRRYPAVLMVHGGPRAAFEEGYYFEPQFYASNGYFVFYCNPRGSAGKGNAFADIRGERYGKVDFDDLMQFTDKVLELYPEIDPDRLCMTGGSYGGFMANWIIGHTDRFAAVVSVKSIASYITKELTSDIGYYYNKDAIMVDPWADLEGIWAHSPLKYADKVKTPTLFIHADQDYRCCMEEGFQMFTALLMRKVPTKMCLFHGESHMMQEHGKPKNRVSHLEETLAWFNKYSVKK